MSLTSVVFLRRARLPSVEQWATAIRKAGYALTLDETADLETLSGRLPCRHEGRETGFEYFLGTAEDAAGELSPKQRKQLGDRDAAVSFVTHGSALDLVTGAIASGVLCATADGVLFDEETGDLWAGKQALRRTQLFAEDLEANLSQEQTRRDRVPPASWSTAKATESALEARIVFRGATVLMLETDEAVPRRLNVRVDTAELPQATTVRLLGLWECAGHEPEVRRFSIGGVERTFDSGGNLALEQIDFEKWIAKLGQVEAATRALIAGGATSIPFLLAAARDPGKPVMTRQLAVQVIGVIGPRAAGAAAELEQLSSDPALSSAAQRALQQIRKP